MPEYCHRYKHHTDKINIIGFISSRGVGTIEIFEENMDAKLLKKLLTNNVLASAKKLFGENYHNWWFLHDNDKKFTSGLVKKWCFDNGIQCLDFPPYSPDLNPIEHIWVDLKNAVEKRNPQSLLDLKQIIPDEWAKISEFRCTKLINSMKKRCENVIANNGFRTKY